MKRQKTTKNGHIMSVGAEVIEILIRKSIMVIVIMAQGYFERNSMRVKTINLLIMPLAEVTNQLYKDDSVYFTSQNKETVIQIEKQVKSGDVLFGEINSDYKALYFNGDYSLPMKSGRFFRPTDFLEENNYVVVGSSHESSITQRNGKSFFSYGWEEFEVLGILGMDIASPLDKMILFNLKNVR
jgi:hypothetical protein